MNVMLAKKEDFEEVFELGKVFEECMERFPELKTKGVQLKVVRSGKNGGNSPGGVLEGAKGRVNGKPTVILWVPDQLWGQWKALRPIIYHELCHYVDLHHPDRVFFERADEKSKRLWKMLEKAGVVKCEVPDSSRPVSPVSKC
jgi:hypothetical protein